MNYSDNTSQIINWLDRAIDRKSDCDERVKFMFALQTLILLAGILRSKFPLFPHEERTHKIYCYTRKIIAKLDPVFATEVAKILARKNSCAGRMNINGADSIEFSKCLAKFTKTKANKIRSAVRNANKQAPSYNSNRCMVKSCCDALGLPIDLILLSDLDLDDLDSYLTANYAI
jgi:hypothetical protein